MGKGEAGDDIRRALRIQDEGIEWKEAERRKSRVFGICVGAKDLRAVCRRSWATREVKGMKWTLNSSNVDDGRVVGVKEKGGRDGGDVPVGLVCETPSAVCTRSRPAKTLHWAHNQICLVRCLRCPPRGPSLSRPRCAVHVEKLDGAFRRVSPSSFTCLCLWLSALRSLCDGSLSLWIRRCGSSS